MFVEDAARIYDVVVDHESLKPVTMGRKRPGYSLRLEGSLDSRWVENLASLQAGLQESEGFQLDRLEGTISFRHEADAPPTEVIDKLERLDDLVARANFLASR